jgi:hypothetical protein
VKEGKLLGHIISRDGIIIDPNRLVAIQKINNPRRKKEVQSFLGRIIFLRRFIPNLTEIINHITNMLSKGNEIIWTTDANHYFEQVKVSLIEAPILVSPYFSRDFIIFSFSSEHNIAGVLMQKKNHNQEQPIFFSVGL